MSALSGIAEMLRNGRFFDALEATKAAVRANPSDLPLRRTLFGLLVASGDWERSRNQAEALGTLGDGESDWISLIGMIASSERRSRFWNGVDDVNVIGLPDEDDDRAVIDAARVASRVCHGSGDFSSLAQLHEMAADFAFGPGEADGGSFDELRTLDDRLPGILEVGRDGGYHWLWLGSVAEMELSARPGNLIDLRWIPARIVLEDGSREDVTLFGTLPGTESSGDEAAMIGRDLKWLDVPDDLAVGCGLVAVSIDGCAHALHGMSRIRFHSEPTSDDSPA